MLNTALSLFPPTYPYPLKSPCVTPVSENLSVSYLTIALNEYKPVVFFCIYTGILRRFPSELSSALSILKLSLSPDCGSVCDTVVSVADDVVTTVVFDGVVVTSGLLFPLENVY